MRVRERRADTVAKNKEASAALVLRAWLRLLYVDLIMSTGGLDRVHRLVSSRSVRPIVNHNPRSLCHSMDLACVFYFKRVLCLQRSAATAMLLRHFGWNAAMFIGVQVLPFHSHAWVEIGNEVMNDRPYMREIYKVLDRC